ncbi:MobH family relaxase [Pseudomonas sp. UBA1879]|uniref:MobH family relaxase n=1 Tax=Pseudomonas sp. UBA1879 TaxID=1947305 RepID=UPI0025D93E9F|nr:MobH family relaxase [Pseudomonas sp. UBA1879]
MFSLFRRNKAAPDDIVSTHGFLPPQESHVLLAYPRRQALLENIWQRASLSRQQFQTLYRMPLHRYADLVQQLPASENHHHAHLGGMLDHGLEIVAYALKIRQSYLLPIGAPPESQSAQAEAWTAAAAYGALLHDVGKLVTDIQVERQDGSAWHPWHGPLRTPYRFRYVKGRDYHLHGAAAALIYTQILSTDILDWLSGFAEAWSQLIFVLAGQYERAGILGEIVIRADQASVAQELGGNPSRALAAPKQSLQRQLAEGLRHLVRDRLKLNQPDGPSDGWLTDDALWLVSKPIADQLRAYLLTQGIENVPSSNAPFFNMLQDQGVIQTNAQDKAIWKVAIDNGKGWKNTFTLLKLSPALIWNDPGDRPPAYFGTLTVETATATETTEENVSSRSKQPTPSTEYPQADTSDSTNHSELPRAGTCVDPDEIAALLGLLDGIDTPTTSPDDNALQAKAESTTQENATATDAGDAATADASAEQLGEAPSTQTVDLGQGFVDWLRTGLASRRIIINDTKALVHTVAGTAMLVTPGIFKRFVQEFPALEAQAKARNIHAWQLVQRAFEKQKLHLKTEKSLNIWTCTVTGPRSTKQLKGYLLKDPLTIFVDVPFDNPSLSVEMPVSEKV